MNSVECVCYHCGKTFNRRKACHNQSLRLNRKEFCDLSCAGANSNRSSKRCHDKTNKNLKKGSEKDEYSEFRWFLRVIKQRTKKDGFNYDVTLPYLKELWNKQNGICPLTGWSLILPLSRSKTIWPEFDPIKRASIDRIDSNYGYIKGNVRFIAVIANYAKSVWSDTELIQFCKAVTENRLLLQND